VPKRHRFTFIVQLTQCTTSTEQRILIQKCSHEP